MFIGHYGAGFAAKRLDKSISLGVFFLLATLPDILWNILILLRIEKVEIVPGITKANPFDMVYNPFSHGFAANLAMGVVIFALFRWALGHKTVKAGLAAAFAVLSHFLLDFVSHRPDLPILLGAPKLGLGMWNYPAVTHLVESFLLIGGVLLYLAAVKKVGLGKKIGISLFGSALLGIYFMNAGGPAPVSESSVALTGMIFNTLFIVLAFGLDKAGKNRKVSAGMSR